MSNSEVEQLSKAGNADGRADGVEDIVNDIVQQEAKSRKQLAN